jgi:hypothetical protein
MKFIISIGMRMIRKNQDATAIVIIVDSRKMSDGKNN